MTIVKTSSVLLLLAAIAAAMLSSLAPMVAEGIVSSAPAAANSVETITSIVIAEMSLPIYQPRDADGKTHAEKTHTEAPDVYRSCLKNGVGKAYMEFPAPDDEDQSPKVHLLCRMDNKMGIGDWIFRVGPALLTEITAFVPKDGTLKAIQTWLANKGAVEITYQQLLKLLGIGG